MKLVVYGGIGEHGRNCFLIQGNHACFLLDAGTGGSGELPSLPSEVIPRLCCVFLSHSHADHSGALFLLAKYGFHGKLLATTETLAQISSPVPSLSLDHGHYGPVSWYWGRSGHCIGSAWISITFEGKRILYSGDYYEESGGYLCDPIRGQQADIALIDAAYGVTDLSIEKAASTILGEIRRQLEVHPLLLFPVPKHGRGQDLLRLFSLRLAGIPIWADKRLLEEKQQDPHAFWLHPFMDDAKELEGIPRRGIVLFCDPQLNTGEGRELARHAFTICTGTIDASSNAEEIIRKGLGVFLRYPVHQNLGEYMALCRKNQFTVTVPFHCPSLGQEQVVTF